MIKSGSFKKVPYFMSIFLSMFSWISLKQKIRFLSILGGTLVVLEILNQGCGHSISHTLGLVPRSLQGVLGIFFSHFLHGDFTHLITNLVPLLTLSAIILFRGSRDFFWATLSIMIGSGVGTWIVGKSGSVHVGSSGLIFGYIGFLFALGFIERSLISLGSAVGVALVYRSFLWGLLPIHHGVSWEMHTFGFMAGIWAASTLSYSQPFLNKLNTLPNHNG